MAALGVIFLIVTVAVFCPLLANQAPLYFKGTMKSDFEEKFLIVDEQMVKLQEAGAKNDRAEMDAALREISIRIPQMEEHLNEEYRAILEEILADLRAAAAGTFDEAKFNEGMTALTEKFFDNPPPLLPVERYPAFRALKKTELWFLLFYPCALLALALRKLLRRPAFVLAFMLLPPTALTYGITKAYPPREDFTRYRNFFEAPDFASTGGKVITTPVPFGENENILEDQGKPPSWASPIIMRDDGTAVLDRAGNPKKNEHLLGTDTNGRDVLARTIYGARVSMVIGILAVALYVSIGVVLGALAGFFRGLVDIALSRIIEVVICFPFLIVILSVQVFLPASMFNVVLALGLLSWTGVARLQRGEFLRLVNLDFVQAVRALGGSNARIIFKHILPNAVGPILVVVSFGIPSSILVESALSFLGFGVPQPQASWGDLLNNGRNDPQKLWWLTTFPGLILFLTLTCFNLVGEGVRDALDPRRDR